MIDRIRTYLINSPKWKDGILSNTFWSPPDCFITNKRPRLYISLRGHNQRKRIPFLLKHTYKNCSPSGNFHIWIEIGKTFALSLELKRRMKS